MFHMSATQQCIIYARVSPSSTSRADAKALAKDPHYQTQGLSIEAQLAKCRAYAAALGYEVIGEFQDLCFHGQDSIADRPGLQEVISGAAKTDTIVLVYSLSRLSRRQRLTCELLDDRGEYRLKMVSATEPFETSTPMGRAMLGMMSIFAQLEADMCSERTRAALGALKDRGVKLGRKFFQYEHPDVAANVFAIWRKGGWSFRRLADYLNQQGLPGPRGKRWHATSLTAIVKRMQYVPVTAMDLAMAAEKQKSEPSPTADMENPS